MQQTRSQAINEIRGWRAAVLLILTGFYRLWLATLRIRIHGNGAEALSHDPRNAVIVLWHNRLFVGTPCHNRLRGKNTRLYGLVSASRDGAWLSGFFRMSGIIPVRGSSSRRGMQAARELLRILKDEGDIGITMDGPRGPCYEAQPGGAMIALKSNAPVYLFTVRHQRAWRLRSWDGFYIPWPFSRADVVIEYIEDLPQTAGGNDRESVRQYLQERLNAISSE